MKKDIFLIFVIMLLVTSCLPVKSLSCSKAGGLIHHADGTDRCCEGLTPVAGGGCPENNCKCEMASFGGLIKCSNCGNKICERENFENHCNCPIDCEILKKDSENIYCGNGACESKFKESNKNCVDDCPIPVWGSRDLHKRTDLSNYYEQFRLKCKNSSCCFSSFKIAKKKRSEIFEKISGADCPSGYSLNKKRCKDSYVWCEKRI